MACADQDFQACCTSSTRLTMTRNSHLRPETRLSEFSTLVIAVVALAEKYRLEILMDYSSFDQARGSHTAR